jgi:hypothetical protein
MQNLAEGPARTKQSGRHIQMRLGETGHEETGTIGLIQDVIQRKYSVITVVDIWVS